MSQFTVGIPFLIPSQGEHYMARHRGTKLAEAYLRTLGRHVTRAEGRRIVDIVMYRPRKFSDYANMVSACKGLNDAVKRAGFIVDDSIKWATFTYKQNTLGALPASLIKRFGRVPIVCLTITDETTEHHDLTREL